jgi:hypothetical protein
MLSSNPGPSLDAEVHDPLGHPWAAPVSVTSVPSAISVLSLCVLLRT